MSLVFVIILAVHCIRAASPCSDLSIGACTHHGACTAGAIASEVWRSGREPREQASTAAHAGTSGNYITTTPATRVTQLSWHGMASPFASDLSSVRLSMSALGGPTAAQALPGSAGSVTYYGPQHMHDHGAPSAPPGIRQRPMTCSMEPLTASNGSISGSSSTSPAAGSSALQGCQQHAPPPGAQGMPASHETHSSTCVSMQTAGSEASSQPVHGIQHAGAMEADDGSENGAGEDARHCSCRLVFAACCRLSDRNDLPMNA